MSGNIDIEIADLDLVKQVFDRQKGHFAAIDEYVTKTCTASGGFRGALSFVHGDYERALADAHTGFSHGQTIASTCGDRTAETKAALLAADRRQYEAYAAHERALGHTVPPYTPPPGGGTLGPAGSDAPSGDQATKAFKVDNTYPDRLKKWGEFGSYDRNDHWKRSPMSGPDFLDPKYYGRRAVEGATDWARGHLPQGYEGRHVAPRPNWPVPDLGPNLKTGSELIGNTASVVNNFAGIIQAGGRIQDGQQLDQQIDASAAGPSNTGGYDWATQGGSW